MESFIQVITTTEKQDEAEKIAEVLVAERLAACVQIVGPITSVYRWKGKVERAQEWQCLIKSRDDLYRQVEKMIRENHPYEVPEIIALPVREGSADYLKWLQEELKES